MRETIRLGDRIIHTRRLNDLEFRLRRDVNDEIYGFEIVRWTKNPYFGHEAEYLMTPDSEYYYKDNDNELKIHRNCFKYPESRYTVCVFEKDNEDYWELKFVGRRPLDLNDDDFNDFMELARFAYKELNGE